MPDAPQIWRYGFVARWWAEFNEDGPEIWGAQTKVIAPDDASDVVTFTPQTPDTYYYICSVPGHVYRGMWGRFIVED